MKNHPVLGLILGLLLLTGFSGSKISTGNKAGSIIAGGLKRTYLIHLPASDIRRSMPLVIVLHGGGGNGKSMVKLTNGGFGKLSDKKGFIVVYPNGIEKHWNDGRNEAEIGYETHEKNTDDVGFISALIDDLIKKYNADPKRVYVTGMSNGAIMSYRLGCELSGKRRRSYLARRLSIPRKMDRRENLPGYYCDRYYMGVFCQSTNSG